MNEEYVVMEGDYCYVDTPVFTGLGNCCSYNRKLIMTKEAFRECYRKWILEEQERKMGRWKITGTEPTVYKCSECGEICCCQGRYCPECGAKMQEVEE